MGNQGAKSKSRERLKLKQKLKASKLPVLATAHSLPFVIFCLRNISYCESKECFFPIDVISNIAYFLYKIFPKGILVSGGNDNTIKVWDGASLRLLHALEDAHPQRVLSLAVLTESDLLASGSEDRTIKLWDTQTFAHVHTIGTVPRGSLSQSQGMIGSTSSLNSSGGVTVNGAVCASSSSSWSVRALTFLPSGVLVSGSGDVVIKVWDTRPFLFEAPNLSDDSSSDWRNQALGMSPARSPLASPTDSASSSPRASPVHSNGRMSGYLMRALNGHTNSVLALATLPNNLLASGAWDNLINLWDSKSFELIGTLIGHTGSVNALVVLPNGMLASGSTDNSVRIWNIAHVRDELGCSHVQTLPAPSCVLALAVLPNGILAVAIDYLIQLWELNTYKLLHQFNGHQGPIFSLAVLQDGLFASGSKDGTIKIWDSRKMKLVASLPAHHGGVVSLVSY